MAAGLGLLSLPPAAFWAMTPREIDAALRGRFGLPASAIPLARSDLDALMRRYPDET